MSIPIAAGTQLMLTGPAQAVELLTLSEGTMADGEVLSVLLLGEENPPLRGMVAIPTPQGIMRTIGALDPHMGTLTLRMAKLPNAWQRRDAQRLELSMALRGTTVATPALAGGHSVGAEGPIRFHGTTVDISPGGISARLTVESDGLRLPPGIRDAFIEIGPHTARPVAASLHVVEVKSDLLRGEFDFLQPADWLYLSRLAR